MSIGLFALLLSLVNSTWGIFVFFYIKYLNRRIRRNDNALRHFESSIKVKIEHYIGELWDQTDVLLALSYAATENPPEKQSIIEQTRIVINNLDGLHKSLQKAEFSQFCIQKNWSPFILDTYDEITNSINDAVRSETNKNYVSSIENIKYVLNRIERHYNSMIENEIQNILDK